MDLRIYYQRVREARETLPDTDIVVVSCETPDGGKAGVCSEVPRAIAAKMIVDGTASIADEATADEFRRVRAAAKDQVDKELAANKVPLTVISTAEYNWLRTSREQD